MHHARLLSIALSLLFLLPACRPPEDLEAPPPSASGELGAAGRDHKADKDKSGRAKGEEGGADDTRLSRNGLGKEDFALVEAELECVRAHYKDDETLRGRAEAAVYERYGASEQWVERVRVHLKSEGKYRGKIEDSVALRRNQVCPDGVVGAEMLESLDALLRQEGGEGLIPITDAAGGDTPKAADAEAADAPKADAADAPEAADKETPSQDAK